MTVLTISRQFGAGGLTLGKMVSQELGFALYDNELIQLVAEKARVSTDWVRSMEKEVGKKFQKFISNLIPKSFMDRILDDQRGYIDEAVYVDVLQKIITKIADEGNAVIIGRGGQYILKDRPDAKRILLVSDLETRIRFVEDKYQLSHKQAAALVASDDKRRINLYKNFGRQDYDQPMLYDMVLNTGKLGFDLACRLTCQLVKG
ncbi:MAG: cytidylate kinase-like family protein [Desulfobacterales bacterium]|jgi:cytidylate kinase|nr:cytidylate kinase-like family protein [Desulfobacterales bacterium]